MIGLVVGSSSGSIRRMGGSNVVVKCVGVMYKTCLGVGLIGIRKCCSGQQ